MLEVIGKAKNCPYDGEVLREKIDDIIKYIEMVSDDKVEKITIQIKKGEIINV